MNIESVRSVVENVSQKVSKNNDNVNAGNDFSKVIGDMVNKVDDSQINADNKIQGLIKGEDVSMHEVMLSMQESQLSMQLLIEMRNKLVEAYQEINRVQL
ncbi:MAG: flagellar hook-basal body complex protein FliE [Peptostreptococcaceae bacterium]